MRNNSSVAVFSERGRIVCKGNKRNIPAELARVPLEDRANTRS